MTNILERLDASIASTLSEWSLLTTVIALILAAFVAYPIFFSEEPDTHPLLLARQASISPIRNKRESAVYRSPESPHGYPLKSGLNVRDPNDPKWKGGRDGDLRDIWREVQRGGGKDVDGKDVPAGLIMTVFGKEEVVDHDVKALSKEIEIIGKHMKDVGVKKIALYMPNGAEYLLAIFGMLQSLNFVQSRG